MLPKTPTQLALLFLLVTATWGCIVEMSHCLLPLLVPSAFRCYKQQLSLELVLGSLFWGIPRSVIAYATSTAYSLGRDAHTGQFKHVQALLLHSHSDTLVIELPSSQ